MAVSRFPDPPQTPALSGGLQHVAGGVPEIDLRDLFRKIWRRKGTLVGVTLIGTLIASLIVYQLQPRYIAQSTVMVDPRESRVVDVEAVISGLPADQETIESEIQVLTSRGLAERVVGNSRFLTIPNSMGGFGRFRNGRRGKATCRRDATFRTRSKSSLPRGRNPARLPKKKRWKPSVWQLSPACLAR